MKIDWQKKRFIGDGPLKGAIVKILRKSKHTGSVTIELVEDHKPYNAGDTVVVYPYELEDV